MQFLTRQKFLTGLIAPLFGLGLMGTITGRQDEGSVSNTAPSSAASSTTTAPSSTPTSPTAVAVPTNGTERGEPVRPKSKPGTKAVPQEQAATAAFRAWLKDQGFAETSWGSSFVKIDEIGRIMTDLYPKESNQEAALLLCNVYALQYSPEDPMVIVKAADAITTLAQYSVFDGRCNKG